MAILSTGLEKLSQLAFAPTALREVALNGTAVDLKDYEGDVVAILDVAAGGTSTVTVKLQSSDTSDGAYGDITTVFSRGGAEQASGAVTFAEVSTSASKQFLVFPKGAAKRFVKAVSAVTGTSSHTYSVNAVGAKKYG